MKTEDDIRRIFDAFCKSVLRHEARDYFNEQRRKLQYEISLFDLTDHDFPTITDHYSVEDHEFHVLGYPVRIENDALAEALDSLESEKRDILLLYFFFEMTDNEIAEVLHMVRSSVAYRRTSSIKYIKKKMGEETDV